MGIYLNQDNTLFEKDVNSPIYVDKTGLIEQTNKLINTNTQYVSVSRPRRFGKSMAANMLTAYYSRGCDSKSLFSNLKIAESDSFLKHLNKYNVICLNMYNFVVKTKNIDEMLRYLEEEVLEEFLDEFPELARYKRLDLQKALDKSFAARKTPFIFVIDEWDSVMRYYQDSENEQKKYLDYLCALLKDKSYVALAYITGILPVKKYGKHSALNMFTEYSMENQREFAEFTGFTQSEVAALCKEYDMDLNETKKWYDGYRVRGIDVYNPRSVVLSVTGHDFDNYWTQTETYEALKVYIKMDFDGLKQRIEKMIAGEKIAVNTGKFQNDMTSLKSADDVLTLLIHLGYLTYDFDTKCCWIPNMEVQREFLNCIEDGGWEPVMNAIKQSECCLTATLCGDSETVAKIVEQTHQENTSIIEYHDENSLACIVTLSYYTAKNKYFVIRELPSGKGYADIAFIPRPNEKLPAIVVELKRESSPSIAVEQIKKREYFDCLKNFSGEIVLVGINYTVGADKSDYKKHSCVIERIFK